MYACGAQCSDPRALLVTYKHLESCLTELSFYGYMAADECRLPLLHAKQSLHSSLARPPPLVSLTHCTPFPLAHDNWMAMDGKCRQKCLARLSVRTLPAGMAMWKGNYFKAAMDCGSHTQTIRPLTAACSELLLSKSKVSFYNQPNLSKVHTPYRFWQYNLKRLG